MALKHAFESGKPDSADATLIQPSHWNSDHVSDSAGFMFASSADTAIQNVAAGQNYFYNLRRKFNASENEEYEFVVPDRVLTTDYNFDSQTPGINLTAGITNTITLTPVPLGINGINKNHYLYISAGTGTAEAVLITGGTATSGAASGTITFVPANNHSGAWTIQSATAGCMEAFYSNDGVGSICIEFPSGIHSTYAAIIINAGNLRICGSGYNTIIFPQFATGDIFSFKGTEAGAVNNGNEIKNLLIGNFNIDPVNRVGIRVKDQIAFHCKDVWIRTISSGIIVEGGSYHICIEGWTMDNFEHLAGYGVSIAPNIDASEYVVLRGFVVGTATNRPIAAIRLFRGGGHYLIHNSISFCEYGIIIDPTAVACTWIYSLDNVYDFCVQTGVVFNPGAGGTVRGYFSSDDWISTCDLYGMQLGNAVGSVSEIFHTNLRCTNNGYYGIQIGVNISDVGFVNTYCVGNSRLETGVHPGVIVADGASNWQIIGGFFGTSLAGGGDPQSRGIQILPGASDYYSIIGISIRGTTGAEDPLIRDEGTGLHKVIEFNTGINDITPPTIASAASIAAPRSHQNIFYLSGSTTVTTITGGHIGRKIKIIKTASGTIDIGGGGNIPLVRTLAQYESLELVFDGSNWY